MFKKLFGKKPKEEKSKDGTEKKTTRKKIWRYLTARKLGNDDAKEPRATRAQSSFEPIAIMEDMKPKPKKPRSASVDAEDPWAKGGPVKSVWDMDDLEDDLGAPPQENGSSPNNQKPVSELALSTQPVRESASAAAPPPASAAPSVAPSVTSSAPSAATSVVSSTVASPSTAAPSNDPSPSPATTTTAPAKKKKEDDDSDDDDGGEVSEFMKYRKPDAGLVKLEVDSSQMAPTANGTSRWAARLAIRASDQPAVSPVASAAPAAAPVTAPATTAAPAATAKPTSAGNTRDNDDPWATGAPKASPWGASSIDDANVAINNKPTAEAAKPLTAPAATVPRVSSSTTSDLNSFVSTVPAATSAPKKPAKKDDDDSDDDDEGGGPSELLKYRKPGAGMVQMGGVDPSAMTRSSGPSKWAAKFKVVSTQ